MSRLSVNDPQVVAEAAVAIGVELGAAEAIALSPEVESQDNVQDALEALEDRAEFTVQSISFTDTDTVAELLTVLETAGILVDTDE